jgi:hypothetical protein
MSTEERLHEENGTTVDMVLFNEALNRQQYRQDLHDMKYHTDIYVLPKAKRLTHLVLHHCKYVSELVLRMENWTPEWRKQEINGWKRFERIALDGIIVSLSVANICGRRLPGSFATMPWPDNQARDAMIASIGKMAKTIEDIDHMGQTNPIFELWTECTIMFSTYVDCLRLVGVPFWEMVDAVNARLLAVESKHMYHKHYVEWIDERMGLYDKSVWEEKECQKKTDI